MKKLLLSAALATAIVAPSAASAQAIPTAVIAVVDLERVTRDCTACRTANAALQSQANALKARQQQLAAPLQAEGKSIQAAIDALNGKQADAALQARVSRRFRRGSNPARPSFSASRRKFRPIRNIFKSRSPISSIRSISR
jgi:Outer membrane protein (OmpH-like).